VQQVYPLQGSRERRNAVFAHKLPIEYFFGVTDVLDQFGRSLFAEPLPENVVVALSEGGQELPVGDRETFAGHSVAPGLPMAFGRVDQGSIHVPEYCSIHGHESPVETWVRLSGIRIDLVKVNLGIRLSPNRFSYTRQRELLQALGIAVELANARS